MRFLVGTAILFAGTVLAYVYGKTHSIGMLFAAWFTMITAFAIISEDEKVKGGANDGFRRLSKTR